MMNDKSVLMDEVELFYHTKSNSLYEMVKLFSNTAVVKLHSAGGGDYSVVTVPKVDGYSIDWHLKFVCTTKQTAIDTAKGIDEQMAEFRNTLEFISTAGDIEETIGKNQTMYSFDSGKALHELLEEHSYDEIKTVLSVYIGDHVFDGRISSENKEWAKRYIQLKDIDLDKFSGKISHLSNNGLVNMLADRMREVEKSVAQISTNEENDNILDLTQDKKFSRQ